MTEFVGPYGMDLRRTLRACAHDGNYYQAAADEIDRLERQLQAMRNIETLRAEEGDTVTILCDNPDFNGQPQNAIECNGSWTDWKDLRIAGDSVAACLSAAAERRRQHDTLNSAVIVVDDIPPPPLCGV